jgi:hypothetical protein
MKPTAGFVLSTATVAMVIAGCAGTAAPTASPSELATPTLVGTAEPTAEPTTVASASPTPGATLIPYPGPSIPPGTLTIEIRAVEHLMFDRATLSAPADRPFVIHFANQDDIGGGQYEVAAAHNVAIKLGNALLFNPLPAIFAPATADYFISEGLPAGTYRFLCTVHPLMNGALTVG